MKGFINHLIVENDLFERKLSYQEEHTSWGIEPYQILSMLRTGNNPMRHRELASLGEYYYSLHIATEVEEEARRYLDKADDLGYTPISIACEDFARLFVNGYTLEMPAILFVKGNLNLLEENRTRVFIDDKNVIMNVRGLVSDIHTHLYKLKNLITDDDIKCADELLSISIVYDLTKQIKSLKGRDNVAASEMSFGVLSSIEDEAQYLPLVECIDRNAGLIIALPSEIYLDKHKVVEDFISQISHLKKII